MIAILVLFEHVEQRTFSTGSFMVSTSNVRDVRWYRHPWRMLRCERGRGRSNMRR